MADMSDIQTVHVHMNGGNIDEEQMGRAAEILKAGGLVVFPTETVYGLGANAFDASATRKVYEAKGRPSDNPLIVHIADADELDGVAVDIPDGAKALVSRFWPGPLTLVLKKNPDIPDETTGGLSTVAVRCPSDKIARSLIKACGFAIAAPSANRSGRPSATRYSHVSEDLDGRVDMIIDGGDSAIGLESTILDMTGEVPVILRPGYITREQLVEVLGTVEYDEPGVVHDDSHPKAPGMKYRHYAPKGELVLIKGNISDTVRYINKLTDISIKKGDAAVVLCHNDTRERYRSGTLLSMGERGADAETAVLLYDLLRRCDTLGADVIYAEYPTGSVIMDALENRLLKAASFRVLEAPPPKQRSKRRKVIFAEGHGNARSAMAWALFERLYEGSDIDACSRGIVVQFEEPLNQKTEAVLISNGITLEGFTSVALSNDEINGDTMIFAMDERQRQQILHRFSSANDENTFLLSSYVGDDLEVMDPYGGNLQVYGICYEVIRLSVQKLADILMEL